MRYEDFDTFIEYRIDETRDPEGFHLRHYDSQIISANVHVEFQDDWILLQGLGLNYLIPRRNLVWMSISMKETNASI